MPDDSYPVLLERALAQAIHDSSVGFYKTSGAYTTAEATLARPAIHTNGPDLPTSIDNCIVITQLEPMIEGRGNIVWRFQIFSRVKGTKVQAKNLAWALFKLLDHKQGIPAGFHISWVWMFSQLAFTADSNGRHSTAQTFYLRGRRPL
jgi:hypothetical protein